jgi:protein-tyrosine phosphatase
MESNDDRPSRLIPLTGAFNFRDLGGYQSGLGGQVQWRRLFRADNLSTLTEGDQKALTDLSITTVIDLRTQREVDQGRIAASEAYAYHHLPMADVLPDTTDARWASPEYVASRYRGMLSDATVRQTLAIAADPASYPLVFHCAAGKDRTGIVAAIMLSLLEVSREDIVADYMLTAPAMERMVTTLIAAAPERAGQIEPHLPAIRGTRPGNIAGLLHMLDEEYGSVADYAERIGAGGTIAGVRANLLGPAS